MHVDDPGGDFGHRCRRRRWRRAHHAVLAAQAFKIVREKETRGLSFSATLVFTLGIGLWLIYGLALGDWPLIGSNAVTLVLMSLILGMKLRYG